MKQVLIAVDQLVNALCAGHADETLSARTWRNRDYPPWRMLRLLIDGLFFWDRDHCRGAYEAEQARRHLPHAYRSDQA